MGWEEVLRDTHVLIAGGGLSRSWSGHERLARGVFVCGGYSWPRNTSLSPRYILRRLSLASLWQRAIRISFAMHSKSPWHRLRHRHARFCSSGVITLMSPTILRCPASLCPRVRLKRVKRRVDVAAGRWAEELDILSVIRSSLMRPASARRV